MSVTFKEVAKLAGVSTQTVSRVTNGSSSVAEETKKKVLAAIDELGYVPNRGAQILSRAKANVVGLITLDIGLHGISLIASSIRQHAQKKGYGISLSIVPDPAFDNMLSAIRELKSQKVENIIFNLHVVKHDAEALVRQFPDLSFVFIDVPPNTKVSSVSASNYEGAQTSANLMLEHKRNKFILISGPENSNASRLRLQGWIDTVCSNDATIVHRFEGDWQAKSGYLSTKEALTTGETFDAILVANDQMALGVLRALDEQGVKVPEQVAVIGFDDTEDSAFFNPPLSTIRQDFAAIGEQAVDFVLNKEESESKRSIATTSLIERQSTAIKQDSLYDKKEIQNLLNQINQLLP
ncbi:LacI family DNA-binding transcriptional regulator [Vibrio hannami]|uniref:LacI family DNA-binding transcriptional regulator n=1 Tax=Vibrio hannami TaxID=2717094 RepID=UPI00240F2ADA|nr:LacI family DNA-binding transcriptional regulator [Vibrio hannami]MDG3087340.1 LacI family DNA-binding transcriptional regulator [Vibrio hannami]